jgi:SAM-dependent methyltransferase
MEVIRDRWHWRVNSDVQLARTALSTGSNRSPNVRCGKQISRASRGKDTSILNVGVGARFFVSRRLDADVLTDVDFPMERLSNFVLCDAHALPFRDNSFNLAYCHNVLEHVANPWQVIRELRRVALHSNIRQDVWRSLVSYATPEHLWLQLPNLKFLQYKRNEGRYTV